MKVILETPRLVLREMSLADLDFVAEMLAHPEVMRYWPKPYSRQEAVDWVRRQQERYGTDGVGYWLALEQASGQPVGQAGLLVLQVEGVEEIGLGYIIHRPFWRRGFATEAAAASRDYALNVLGKPRVIALVRPENVPSQGVALKLGMKPEGRTQYAGYEHLIFAISCSPLHAPRSSLPPVSMKWPLTAESRKRVGRLPLLALGMLSLVCGIWGGLTRLPLNLPIPSEAANWITWHGPLMVGGFLGTVIALERAVGLQKWWNYSAPILSGAGAVVLIAGVTGQPGQMLLTLGSAVFAVVTLRVIQLQRALFTGVMSLGAMAWVTGNILWLESWPVSRVVPCWMAFLALTIVGERLDLSRFQRPVRWARPLLLTALSLSVGGVILSPFLQKAGERLAGVGLFSLALWLGRFDIARHTVKQPGLPRFMAVCLLTGYVWLAVAGVLLGCSPPLESGFAYDATLHSFFLGFVFSMIFGHAPVIFPAVLLKPISFSARLYLHVGLLHAALLLRVAADLSGWSRGRQWGGIFNGIAVALFVVNTIVALATAARAQRPARAP